jgi:hypothetical protein
MSEPNVSKLAKLSPLADLAGLYGCEMLWIPHCIDSRFADGSKFVSPTLRPSATPQRQFYVSGTHFC